MNTYSPQNLLDLAEKTKNEREEAKRNAFESQKTAKIVANKKPIMTKIIQQATEKVIHISERKSVE